MNVWKRVMIWPPIQNVFPPHSQVFQHSLRIHCDPSAVTESEWIFAHFHWCMLITQEDTVPGSFRSTRPVHTEILRSICRFGHCNIYFCTPARETGRYTRVSGCYARMHYLYKTSTRISKSWASGTNHLTLLQILRVVFTVEGKQKRQLTSTVPQSHSSPESRKALPQTGPP